MENKNENTKDLLVKAENEGLCAVQLFGREPDILRRACEIRDDIKNVLCTKVIDIINKI